MPETFEKCPILFKDKEDENFNHPSTICRTYPSTIFRSYGAGEAGSNTDSISRINPPKFGGGLKFESDPREIGYAFHGAGADIGGKNSFRSGAI